MKGVSVEERMQHEHGTSNPTVEDVLKTDRYVKMRVQLKKQLSNGAATLSALLPTQPSMPLIDIP